MHTSISDGRYSRVYSRFTQIWSPSSIEAIDQICQGQDGPRKFGLSIVGLTSIAGVNNRQHIVKINSLVLEDFFAITKMAIELFD